MLFYSSFTPQKPLNEVEVDGQPAVNNEEPVDYTGSEEQPEQEPATSEPTDQQPEENPTEDPGMDQSGEEPVDYTTAGDDMGGEPSQDGEGAPPPADSSEQPAEVNDIKKQEEELYNELSPEQLDIKHKELKSQFLSMYDMVVALIDKLGSVSAAEEDIVVIEYISNELSKLKDMITDYVNEVYKTKSYIENSINYNRFLAILSGINKILEEMNSKNDEK